MGVMEVEHIPQRSLSPEDLEGLVLKKGEASFINRTGFIKLGDGVTPWQDLPVLSPDTLGGTPVLGDGTVDLSAYALKTDLPDLSGYALQSDIPAPVDLSGYVTDQELQDALAATTIGQEIGYAERNTTDTTTSLPDDDPTLMANLITGMHIPNVLGIGRPVEIELYFPVVGHSVAGGVVYGTIMMNGARIQGCHYTSQVAGKTGHMVCKRRMVLAAGQQYTFDAAKTIDTAGTATYFMNDAFVGYLSVTQR